MSIFENLFLPGARHREDEDDRLEWSREQAGLGEPHRGPIDLDGGTSVIRPPDQAEPSGSSA